MTSSASWDSDALNNEINSISSIKQNIIDTKTLAGERTVDLEFTSIGCSVFPSHSEVSSPHAVGIINFVFSYLVALESVAHTESTLRMRRSVLQAAIAVSLCFAAAGNAPAPLYFSTCVNIYVIFRIVEHTSLPTS